MRAVAADRAGNDGLEGGVRGKLLGSRFDSFEVCPGVGTVVTTVVACGVPEWWHCFGYGCSACYGVPCYGTGLLAVSVLVPCGNRYLYPVWVMVCDGTSCT
ncbi:hypothetical protein Taro_015858, partial [Colocasia esculenta]|nr:hypothetical protein [Colocasia esculenta]